MEKRETTKGWAGWPAQDEEKRQAEASRESAGRVTPQVRRPRLDHSYSAPAAVPEEAGRPGCSWQPEPAKEAWEEEPEDYELPVDLDSLLQDERQELAPRHSEAVLGRLHECTQAEGEAPTVPSPLGDGATWSAGCTGQQRSAAVGSYLPHQGQPGSGQSGLLWGSDPIWQPPAADWPTPSKEPAGAERVLAPAPAESTSTLRQLLEAAHTLGQPGQSGPPAGSRPAQSVAPVIEWQTRKERLGRPGVSHVRIGPRPHAAETAPVQPERALGVHVTPARWHPVPPWTEADPHGLFHLGNPGPPLPTHGIRRWVSQPHSPCLAAHKCEQCGAGFPSGEELCEHRREKHQPAPLYFCQTCGKAYALQDSLRHHVWQIHTRQRVRCPVCGHSYSTQFSLNRHRKNAGH